MRRSSTRSPLQRQTQIEVLEQRKLLAVFLADGDTTSIQDAVDAAAENAGPDTVLIAEGVYQENVSINDSAPLLMRGDGEVVITAADEEAPAVEVEAGDVTLRNLTVTGGKCGVVAQPFDEATAVDLELIDVNAVENAEHGVQGEGLGELTILRGNYSRNGYADDADEENGDDYHGITLKNTGAFNVKKATVEGNDDRGMNIKADAVFVRQVQSVDNGGDALKVDDAGRVRIWHSIFSNNGSDGIDLADIGTIQVWQSSASGNADEGLEVDDSDSVTVLGGEFSGNADDGLDLDNNRNITVVGVVASDNGTVDEFGEGDGNGLQIESDSSDRPIDRILIVNSIFENNAQDGIQIVEDVDEGAIAQLALFWITASDNRESGVDVDISGTVRASRIVSGVLEGNGEEDQLP